jgi:formylglycine-generating enzyme required for sulfatase activity
MTATQPVLPEEISHDFLGMKLRLIHPGSYLMGSPNSELGGDGKHHADEWQGSTELTRPIYMSELDVTRGMFKVFVEEDHYVTDAERESGNYGAAAPWLNPGIWQDDRHPVVQVSWHDAVAFTSWLTHKTGKQHRLPLEAEWEYACRAGTTTPYSTGQTLDPLYANFMPAPGAGTNANGSGIGTTTPAGIFRPNPWGLYDMHGNVMQWCLDDHDPGTPPGPLAYAFDATPTGKDKNLRGGSWSHPAIDARSANRWGKWPGYHETDVGFRVVMEP